MGVPAGYYYKDGAYWAAADSSGPYGVTPAGVVVPLFQYAYEGTWASRPAASAVAAGSKMRATDVGVGGYSEWVSNGTNWRPLNGSVLLFEDRGSAASPIATLTGDGVATQMGFVIPGASSVRLPAGMPFAGSRLSVMFEGARGAVATVATNFSCRLDTVTVSTVNTGIVSSLNAAATASLFLRGWGTAVFQSATAFTGSRNINFGQSATGFTDYSGVSGDTDSNPPYVTFYIQAASLPAGETFSLLGYQVYFEG